jgi:hypothetical protein
VNCRHLILSALATLLATPTLTCGGWPFTQDGPRHGSREYYEMRAGEPIGSRQRCHHGKVWPPQPRPAGKPLPWIHRFYAIHYWPWPYTDMDIADVNYVSELQTGNGWVTCTTFFDYHFDPVTQELNSSGLAHLQWIMVNVPVQYRQAYVASSGVASTNDVRISSIQQSVAAMAGNSQALSVAVRVATPTDRPAQEVDAIFKQRLENMDTPVIPFTQATTGGGGAAQ